MQSLTWTGSNTENARTIQNGRTDARSDQLSRQWRLIQLIDRPQGITVDDASRDLTIRTGWRDLRVLEDAGFPLYTERADGDRGVWRVREEFKRALPRKLTLGELPGCVSYMEQLANGSEEIRTV